MLEGDGIHPSVCYCAPADGKMVGIHRLQVIAKASTRDCDVECLPERPKYQSLASHASGHAFDTVSVLGSSDSRENIRRGAAAEAAISQIAAYQTSVTGEGLWWSRGDTLTSCNDGRTM